MAALDTGRGGFAVTPGVITVPLGEQGGCEGVGVVILQVELHVLANLKGNDTSMLRYVYSIGFIFIFPSPQKKRAEIACNGQISKVM